jgi:hypothetical protein
MDALTAHSEVESFALIRPRALAARPDTLFFGLLYAGIVLWTTVGGSDVSSGALATFYLACLLGFFSVFFGFFRFFFFFFFFLWLTLRPALRRVYHTGGGHIGDSPRGVPVGRPLVYRPPCSRGVRASGYFASFNPASGRLRVRAAAPARGSSSHCAALT